MDVSLIETLKEIIDGLESLSNKVFTHIDEHCPGRLLIVSKESKVVLAKVNLEASAVSTCKFTDDDKEELLVGREFLIREIVENLYKAGITLHGASAHDNQWASVLNLKFSSFRIEFIGLRDRFVNLIKAQMLVQDVGYILPTFREGKVLDNVLITNKDFEKVYTANYRFDTTTPVDDIDFFGRSHVDSPQLPYFIMWDRVVRSATTYLTNRQIVDLLLVKDGKYFTCNETIYYV